MKQNKKYGLLFILIILMFTVSGALASGANTIHQIEFSHNTLAANLKNVPLGSVLERIKEKTGIEFVLNEKEAERIISVRFQSLPIERALERILDKLNYAVIFGPAGKNCRVIIYGKNKISLTSRVHEDRISSSTNTATIEPLGKEGMKIFRSPENRIPDGMKIFRSPENRIPDGMKISHSPENRIPDGMKIYQSPDAGIPDGMKISHSPENRIPDGMKIFHP